METILGTAADVPYTALPPTGMPDGPAPLIVTWHMLDAPRTDAAFAAALPMVGVPAWRVHLGMPMCGARMVDGSIDAVLNQLPVDDQPISILGGSLGAAVALEVLTRQHTPIRAVALINPAVRIRSVVPLVEGLAGRPYSWTAEADETADELDFVARVADLTAQPPLLLVSGEQDHPALRTDAADLVHALRVRYTHPKEVELVNVPDLAHPLADEPGLEPAPQLPAAKTVDGILTQWLFRQLTMN